MARSFGPDVAKSLIPSLVLAILTAYLTVRLSLRQFFSQRWWERKADAYAAIIEALAHEISMAYDTLDAEERNVTRRFDDERKQASREAQRRINQAASAGAFIISEPAAEALTALRRELLGIDANSFYEHIEREYSALTTCLKSLRECAKKDLRIPN